MTRGKRVFMAGISGLLMAFAPLSALAASPEFSRSEEEWARLRDDVLEYDEITDLVHEYNATVRKNQIDLNEFRKEYGLTNDEWADRYREVADEAESNLEYPDYDDTSYAALMAAIISSEMQIDTLRETADDALEDYYVNYYTNVAEELGIASAAQGNMVSYYLNQIQLQDDQRNLDFLQLTYDHIVQQEQIGTATSIDVLQASDNLKAAQKAIQDDESAIESARESLIVALGWSHDATPEIRALPEVDFERIETMDPIADKEEAVENSFTQKANKQRLSNAYTEDKISSLQTTVDDTEKQIGASLNSAYQSVLAAKAAYDLNVAQAELEANNLQISERGLAQGTVSQFEYLTQENTAKKAEIAVQTAYLSLFDAMRSYEWMLNGLAGA